MKKLGTALLTTFLTVAPALAQVTKAPVAAFAEHGGGNGGDDFELELKKRSLQIGYFLKSSVGAKTFSSINADAVLEAINRTDIDVVAGNVVDKYGTIRTCVNEENRGLITCNLDRLNELKKKNQLDVMTAMLFHEILGIMGLELGYQENVSMYPVSSKILPYWSVIEATPVSEANIRPEYYGVDSASYGITLVNKETKETLRMICLNDNIEIHRCRNYSVVRSANGRQAPLVSKIVSISPADLGNTSLPTVLGNYSYMGSKEQDAYDLTVEILNLKNNLSLIGKTKTVKNKVFELVLNNTTKAVLEKENIPARLAKAEADKIEQEKRNAEYKVEQEKKAELARIQAVKDAEAKKIADWDNRKDAEQMTQIGDFSVVFKKDFVAVANTTSLQVYSSRYWNGADYKTMSCSIQYPLDTVDRLIVGETVLKRDWNIAIVTPDASAKKNIVVNPTVAEGKIKLNLECMTDDLKTTTMTIGQFKSYFNTYLNVKLADPKNL